MKLFILPVTCGIILIGCLASIHMISVSGPEKQAAAAKSRAAEARSMAEQAKAQAESAAYAVDLERVKGNNKAHIIAAKALAAVAIGQTKGAGINITQIVCVVFACIILVALFLWFRAEKRAEKLEFILLANATPQIIECIKLSGAVPETKLLGAAR